MQLEIGKVYDGKVKGIAQYGAFVEIEGAGTGMVHISEIANTFVKDVKDYLKENQEVKVKVLSISHVRNANRTSGSQRKSRLCLSLVLRKCSQDSSRTAKKKSVHSKETLNARTVQEENNNTEYPMLKSIGYSSFCKHCIILNSLIYGRALSFLIPKMGHV